LCTLLQAGLPAGWVQVALLNNENAEKLVTDPRVAFFSFIGSANASFDLRYQPTLAEPIKLKNATRGSVTNFSAFSLFNNATCTPGQVCVSVQRVYVPEKRAQDLAEKIATIAARQVVGDAIDENTDLVLLLPLQFLHYH
jgi:acyl-CoA reductase-like NAD-dependent aldehyde dehydrogenase